jgi:hypothetical protein
MRALYAATGKLFAAPSYLREDWLSDYARLDAQGDPEPCPLCRRTGFYGPRGNRTPGPDARRACKFCGFWQHVGQAAFLAVPTVHDCAKWPVILGALEAWWELPEKVTFDCPMPTCGAKALRVAERRVEPPIENRRHPWWSVPQHRSYIEYRAFWLAREPGLAAVMQRPYL